MSQGCSAVRHTHGLYFYLYLSSGETHTTKVSISFYLFFPRLVPKHVAIFTVVSIKLGIRLKNPDSTDGKSEINSGDSSPISLIEYTEFNTGQKAWNL